MGATHTLESGLPVSAVLLQHINYDNFNIPFSRTAMLDKQPLFAFQKLWDELTDHQIKFIRNRFEFNAVLKNYYLKHYQMYQFVTDYYVLSVILINM
jgi:hypothetical protein